MPVFDPKRYHATIHPPENGRFYFQDGYYFDADGRETGCEPDAVERAKTRAKTGMRRAVKPLPDNWMELGGNEKMALAKLYGAPPSAKRDMLDAFLSAIEALVGTEPAQIDAGGVRNDPAAPAKPREMMTYGDLGAREAPGAAEA